MEKTESRMTDKTNSPTLEQVKAWIGHNAYEYWQLVAQWINTNYPDIFSPEWLFGGKKHGWALRYKKSKSFCTFVPEKNNFALLIVFGKEERAKAEKILHTLSASTRDSYEQATTYHDGKWLLLNVDSDEVFEDVKKFLALKRKSKIPSSSISMIKARE